MQDRERRIGYWVSGVAHLALILWALLGGVLLRPQPSTPVRMTEVATMSGAEFEAYAAASRGAGPVGQEATAVADLPQPEDDSTTETTPDDTAPPDAEEAAQVLAAPDAAEARPDLSDFQTRQPVDVASDLPEAPPAPAPQETAPDAPVATVAPSVSGQPARPSAAGQDQAAQPLAPRSALALDRAARPQERPEGLVAAHEARIAAQQAEAERAEAQAAAEAEARQQEAARQAAERAAEEQRAAAEAEKQAAEAAQRAEERRAAQQAAREEEARQAEEARAAEARAAEERAARGRAEEQRRAAEQAAREEEERRAAAEREAAEREAADRQALEDALREAQDPAGEATAATGDAVGDNRQRIEGGSGASAEQDPLAAALSGALSQGVDDTAPETPQDDPMQLAPRPITPQPITPRPLPDPDQGAAAEIEDEGAVPLGQPLSLSEREVFRIAIQQCWNVGALSLEAARMDVSVEFRLGPDGRPDPASLRLVDQRGGSKFAAQNAFDVARRAIIMCGRAGYPLPPEKYGRWREVIVDFRPDGIGFD